MHSIRLQLCFGFAFLFKSFNQNSSCFQEYISCLRKIYVIVHSERKIIKNEANKNAPPPNPCSVLLKLCLACAGRIQQAKLQAYLK